MAKTSAALDQCLDKQAETAVQTLESELLMPESLVATLNKKHPDNKIFQDARDLLSKDYVVFRAKVLAQVKQEYDFTKVLALARSDPNVHLEEAFVTYITEVSHIELLKLTLESVHAFSTRPIIIYYRENNPTPGVPSTQSEVEALYMTPPQYPRVIVRNLFDMHPVTWAKLQVLLLCNTRFALFLEPGALVNYKVDDLFATAQKHVRDYPLLPRMILSDNSADLSVQATASLYGAELKDQLTKYEAVPITEAMQKRVPLSSTYSVLSSVGSRIFTVVPYFKMSETAGTTHDGSLLLNLAMWASTNEHLVKKQACSYVIPTKKSIGKTGDHGMSTIDLLEGYQYQDSIFEKPRAKQEAVENKRIAFHVIQTSDLEDATEAWQILKDNVGNAVYTNGYGDWTNDYKAPEIANECVYNL